MNFKSHNLLKLASITSAIAICSISTGLAGKGADLGKLVFEDQFDRNESQETKDELGGEWSTSSDSRAKGNKQVDLKDGAMYIYIHKVADHAVSVRHPINFKDGSISLRFMLEDEKDTLGLNFADMDYKEVHAGHLLMAIVGTKTVTLDDLKTGKMNKKIRDARKDDSLTPEMKKMLTEKRKKFSHKTKLGKWHDLVVTIEGDTLTATIDGKKVGSFQSEGIAHPTKTLLRLSVPKNAVVDDLKVWKKK